jgi:microsomal dipeptidase-like Zn-dependent dipeptidase
MSWRSMREAGRAAECLRVLKTYQRFRAHRGLAKTGYKEQDIRKIMSGNFLRAMREVVGN